MSTFLLQVGVFFIQRVTDTEYWILVFMPISLLVGSAIAGILHNRRPDDGVGPLAFAMHRISMALGSAPGLRAFVTFMALRQGGMFPGYLMLRYFVRPLVARRPFLYLRSFAGDSAALFVGKVLAPSVGARAVVVGLINERQTGEDLHHETDHEWHAEIFALPDSAWRTWVSDKLSRCIGVVIDMSITSESVAWEFEQARQHLPLDRVLVVSRSPIPADVSETGVTCLVYVLASAPERRAATMALLQWTDRALRSMLRVRSLPAFPAAAERLLFRLMVGAILLWVAGAVAYTLAEADMLFQFAIDPRDGGVSPQQFQQQWLVRLGVVHLISAVLLLPTWPLFRFDGIASPRTSRIWFVIPCAVIGLTSLWGLGGHSGSMSVVVETVGSQAFLAVAGCIILSAVSAHACEESAVDLERVVLTLLAPVAVQTLTVLVLEPIAALVRMPGLLGLGAFGVATADCVAGYTVIVLVRNALNARRRYAQMSRQGNRDSHDVMVRATNAAVRRR